MSWNAISKRLRAAVSICSLLLVGLLATMQWAAQQERKHITVTSQVLFPAALYSQVAASSFQRVTREAADGVIMQDKASLAGADADAGLVFASLRTVQGLVAFRGKRWQEIGALIDRLADLRLRSNKVYSESLAELENLSPDTLSQWAILARETKEAQANLDGLQVNIQNDFRAELEIIRRISWLQEFIGGAIFLVVLATAFFGTRAFIEMAAQKRANEAMRDAHKQNEAVLNSVPSLLIELGLDGYIRRWNRSATTILGWDEKVVRGQPLSSCGIDWLTPGMEEKMAACLQSPAENALGEARFKKDGETRFLGLNAVRLKDKAGESVGTLSWARTSPRERFSKASCVRRKNSRRSASWPRESPTKSILPRSMSETTPIS